MMKQTVLYFYVFPQGLIEINNLGVGNVSTPAKRYVV